MLKKLRGKREGERKRERGREILPSCVGLNANADVRKEKEEGGRGMRVEMRATKEGKIMIFKG